MSRERNYSSLRENTIDAIGNFLYNEGFTPCEITPLGILEIINMISDYYEEGTHLFPEVLLTNNFEFFKTIPNREILIKETELSVEEFKNIIKSCAPLAINNWIIFIEIQNKSLKYGIASAEISDTSPSIYKQTVGELAVGLDLITIAYIRNIGQKTVELIGLKRKLTISLTLENTQDFLNDQIAKLSYQIYNQHIDNYAGKISDYFENIIIEALRKGHGNLIGVINDCEVNITKIKNELAHGIYLTNPIDMSSLIIEAENLRSDEASIALKSYTSILIAMLNNDGITILTNKGRIIGYHIIIDNFVPAGVTVIGGTRTKAFESMKFSKLFIACFYKSQDGNIKFWENNE